MATVTTTVSLSYEDDAGNVRTFGVPLRERTPATAKVSLLTQTIPITVDTPINFGDISSVAEFGVKNLDPTNYVTIKDNDGDVVDTLRPDTNEDGNGGVFLCSEVGANNMSAASATANAGPCDIEVFAVSI